MFAYCSRSRTQEPDPWAGASLGEVLSNGSARGVTVGRGLSRGALPAAPSAGGAGGSPIVTSADERPIRGNASGAYDMSFVDMENEWDRVLEFRIPDGAHTAA